MKVPINPQPHLGRIETSYKPFNKMGGYLALAKIITVHHKHHTADVQIIRSSDVISSSPTNEGKYAARIGVSTAQFDVANNSSSGIVEPFQKDQLVLVAFMDGFKSQPFIVCSFHNTWETTHSILTNKYPLNPSDSLDDAREALKYLRVFPSQFYHKVDGIGSMEMSHPSKTFMVMNPDFKDIITDEHNGFDHKDLSEKDPFTKKTRCGHSEESLLPSKFIFIHRSSYLDEKTTWTKFFIDKTGLFRTTRDNNDGKLTFLEINSEGKVTIMRQLDSDASYSGVNNTSFIIKEDGSMSIKRVLTGVESEISISSTGIISLKRNQNSISIDDQDNVQLSHNTGSYIKMQPNGDIIIQSANDTIIDGVTIVPYP